MNFLKTALVILCTLSTATAAANAESTIEMVPADTLLSVPAEYDNTLDQLVHNWYMSQAISFDCHKDSSLVTYPDNVYIERLQNLPNIMAMPYNSIVRNLINFYAGRRKQVEYMLSIGENYYFPIFERSLAKYNIPLELKYLPVIESALNARAISRAGAGGLWQFMVSTGRIYGLEVNSLVDERCDPMKASDAAARFLRDLYNIYQDWHLVIAAYNCGPGNVSKAIRYAGGKRDYWAIYPYLPRETRSYVPIFIAANYIMNYYQYHNICPATPTINTATDTIQISDRVHLAQISEVLEIPLDELQFHNPQYRQNIIPGNIKPYPLVLPFNKINLYAENRDSILNYRSAQLIPQKAVVEPSGNSHSTSSSTSSSSGVIYYKVKSGDNLGAIAKKYRVTVTQLKKWNGLSSSTIRIGQRLKIYR